MLLEIYLAEFKRRAVTGRLQPGRFPQQVKRFVVLRSSEAAHEIFIADGYINSRMVVYDSETGAFKRGWGAYGMLLSEIDNGKAPKYDPNEPPPKQFLGQLIGLVISEDGLV